VLSFTSLFRDGVNCTMNSLENLHSVESLSNLIQNASCDLQIIIESRSVLQDKCAEALRLDQFPASKLRSQALVMRGKKDDRDIPIRGIPPEVESVLIVCNNKVWLLFKCI